jgi:DNA polymerase-3 subunit alpha
MMDKAAADGQTAVAMTDHGNMFGAFKFVREANKRNIKPIVGCEFYVVADVTKKSFVKSKGERDVRYHQLLLAKNAKGYENLSKLCSKGFKDGLYSKYPRIDREWIREHSEGVIATSCCIGAEIPQAIAYGDLDKAEEILRWYIDVFGEDFYIELQRHGGIEDIDIYDEYGKKKMSGISQEDVNQQLILFAEKYNVKTIATNDIHYIEEDDWEPHDILLCVNTNSYIADENRFRFPSKDFYFKSQQEMTALFSDVPAAIDNTMEIASKVELLNLEREVVLPAFPLPAGFADQDSYLRHLTYEGAKRRWGEINEVVRERLDFELSVIKDSGYPGYFLIVQDFTTVAREMGVSVGPGRGSAAGSAVAYCLAITNIDPIKYDLLFERFLNPERVSMPDIDIDFDDEGRSAVIDYVIDKYGRDQVAQIITYGTMAAKSSIKDVGRVMQVPLHVVNDITTKQFPQALGVSLNGMLADGDISPKLKGKLNAEDQTKAYAIRKLAEGDDEVGDMLRLAKKLEGSVRNTGIHACGVIITPDDITNYVPVSTAKDSDLLVSQFDNSVVEDAGLLKMDFLGLKTLTIIKDAVKLVKETRGDEVDIDDVDLKDEKTYELFSHGDTVGVFQYESVGMQKNLRELKPNTFEDLIAMNALYRPGPMQYIPNFVARKHGREEVSYDLPAMEEYLDETYGITVYQEQVMLLSQKLAGFTKGQADMLRKAMGKKKKKLIDEMWPKFVAGCTENGHPEDVVKKIWTDWEAFASYAFNKSHSTCYAYVAFQTAYLKAHYPAEFMASVLNHNKRDLAKVTFFLRECKRMRIDVLGPSVNESRLNFHVNPQGQIRFGLSAIKGVGEQAVEDLVLEREADGEFTDIYDLVRRVNPRSIGKRVLESMAMGGALDIFNIDRATYFAPSGKYDSFIEHISRYGAIYQQQESQNQVSLFAGTSDVNIDEPTLPPSKPWSLIEQLEKEKEMIGIYISGHPLDDYRLEIENFVSHGLDQVEDIRDRPVSVCGMVAAEFHGTTKKGTGYGRFTVQDYRGSLELALFTEDYMSYKDLFAKGQVLYIEGMMRARWNQEDRYEFKIKKVKLLETVGEQMTKNIKVTIPLHLLDEKTIHQFDTICEEHPGGHTLKCSVVDMEDQLVLDLVSARKVKADQLFVDAMTQISLTCKINT